MIEIKKNIFWNGIKDYDLRSFHGHEMSTHHGSTYNSFLIKDEKIALVDTVWDLHSEEFIRSLKENVGIENIDYIIVNHMEPDHAGCIELLMDINPKIEIYCTAAGEKIIKKYFNRDDWKINTVKTGDKLSLGEYELTFVEMKMIHWPESMLVYIEKAKLLLSNDAFGQHYAAGVMFDDEADTCVMNYEALKYYANILTPFNVLIKKKLDEIAAMNLDIDMIAPSHGVIWRSRVQDILDFYSEWCNNTNDGSVVIIYDTLYGSTKKMAEEISKPFLKAGIPYKMYNAAITDGSDLIADVFSAKLVVVGSPTVHNGMLTTVDQVLARMKHLKFKNKIGAAFGSYGWSGEATKDIDESLNKMGITTVIEPISVKYNLSPEELKMCYEFGEKLVAEVQE